MQKRNVKMAMVCCGFFVLGMVGCGSKNIDNTANTQQTELQSEECASVIEETVTKEKRENVKIGAVPHFECNYDSMLLYDKGYIYEYDGCVLSRYQEDTMNREVLYTSETNTESLYGKDTFFLYQDSIYFLERAADHESVALLRMGMDGSDVERIMEQPQTSVIYIYEDILYSRYYSEEGKITDCYRLGNGKPEKIDQGETIYRFLKDEYQEMDDAMLPYCMEHYGYLLLLDEEGNVVMLNPETMEVVEVDMGSEESLVCITNRFIVSEVSEGEKINYYLTSLDTLEKVQWYQSNQVLHVNGYDELGLYYSVIPNQYPINSPISHHRIVWEESQEETLFAVKEATGTRGYSEELFWIFDGNYYYQTVDAYKLYIAKRDVKNAKETLADKPYSDSRIAELGHIEVFKKDTRCPHCDEVIISDIYAEKLILDDSSAASVKINESLKEKTESYINSDNEYEESDFDYIHDEMYTPYSYVLTVNITYLDENYVSVQFSTYDYLGGAHGMPGQTNYVYDLKSGEELELNDLIGNSQDELNTFITQAFQTELDRKTIGLFEEGTEDIKKIAGYDTMWRLEPDGISFYFSPYEVAPFAAGFPEAKVLYSKLDLKMELGYCGGWRLQPSQNIGYEQ